FGSRADERDALPEASLGETGVFGQQAVAGMYAIAARRLGGFDQSFGVEIGAYRIVRRRPRAERTRLGCDTSVKRERVGRCIYADRFHAQRRRRARDADCYFTPIGNQYALEQGSALH